MNWRTRSRPDFGPRLVAKFRLDLIPDLRQLLVAAQFFPGDLRHDLFVGHAQAQVGALAIFQAKHVVAHPGPAAARLPHLARIQGRQIKLLPDLVHLLADDGDDLLRARLPRKRYE